MLRIGSGYWFILIAFLFFIFSINTLSSRHNLPLAVLSEMNWHWASGSHQPCLLVLWRKGFPSLAKQKQSFGIEAAILISIENRDIRDARDNQLSLAYFEWYEMCVRCRGLSLIMKFSCLSEKYKRKKGVKTWATEIGRKKNGVRLRPQNIPDE